MPVVGPVIGGAMKKNSQPKVVLVSGPVIIENGKVLLNKHGDENFWKFPGGRVENFDFVDGEDVLEKTARREVKEELGIDIEIIKPLRTLLLPKSGDKNVFVILVHYLAKRIGEIKPSDEIKEWDWIDINNLPKDVAENVRIVFENKADKI